MNSVVGDLRRFKSEFFHALAHPIRIEILEALLQDERSVQELQEILGVDQPVVSQHLAILRARNIVAGRKEGTSVRYLVRDRLIGKLLGVAREIFNNHLADTQGLLRELKRQTRRR
jgi:ArsR family transcriptional regulator